MIKLISSQISITFPSPSSSLSLSLSLYKPHNSTDLPLQFLHRISLQKPFTLFNFPYTVMEMEVIMPVLPVDFNFDSTCSSPYVTAPSSPQRFGNFFFSAPASPSRCKEINGVSLATNCNSKSRNEIKNQNDSQYFDFVDDGGDEDFEFNFSGQLDRTSLSAEELFDGGKIRPLKPPPGYDSSVSTVYSPRSPRSRTALKRDFDPFQAAIEETRRRETKQQQNKKKSYQRGRERTISSSSSSSSKSSNYVHKGSRSLSPMRVCDLMLDQEDDSHNAKISSAPSTAAAAATANTPKSSSSSFSYSSFLSAISFSSSKGHKKWKLKDLLLFRSASEGRATGKDPLIKYEVLSKREVAEDAKNASFRSTDSSVSVGGSSRRRGRVSAHELHYTANRAVSEEMKRKTFLPYRHGLLGCLGFNHGVHDISRSIGSLTRG